LVLRFDAVGEAPLSGRNFIKIFVTLLKRLTLYMDKGEFVLMSKETEPKILNAERLDGGVVISFSNGKTAVYSAALLYSVLEHAASLTEDELGDEPSVGA
jgi:hypothetical protein